MSSDVNLICRFSAADPKSTLSATCLHRILLQFTLKQLIIQVVNLERFKCLLKESLRDTIL